MVEPFTEEQVQVDTVRGGDSLAVERPLAVPLKPCDRTEIQGGFRRSTTSRSGSSRSAWWSTSNTAQHAAAKLSHRRGTGRWRPTTVNHPQIRVGPLLGAVRRVADAAYRLSGEP